MVQKYLQRHIKSRYYRNLGRFRRTQVHPSTILHGNGKMATKFKYLRNGLGKISERKFCRNFTKSRPFILMRAGYSGAQRNGLVPWSGDVSRSWGGLQSQPDIVLQMGLPRNSFAQ